MFEKKARSARRKKVQGKEDEDTPWRHSRRAPAVKKFVMILLMTKHRQHYQPAGCDDDMM